MSIVLSSPLRCCLIKWCLNDNNDNENSYLAVYDYFYLSHLEPENLKFVSYQLSGWVGATSWALVNGPPVHHGVLTWYTEIALPYILQVRENTMTTNKCRFPKRDSCKQTRFLPFRGSILAPVRCFGGWSPTHTWTLPENHVINEWRPSIIVICTFDFYDCIVTKIRYSSYINFDISWKICFKRF